MAVGRTELDASWSGESDCEVYPPGREDPHRCLGPATPWARAVRCRNPRSQNPLNGCEKTMTDRILILDFGSQVTQLIARRVRESGVYCEIHPYTIGEDKVRDFDPRGDHPVGRSGLGDRGRLAARARDRVPARRAGAGHLLRHADDVRRIGRPRRAERAPGIRPRLCRCHRRLPVVRRAVAQGRAARRCG